MLSDKPNIAVITFPFYTKVSQIFMVNFVEIIEPLSNEIYAITGRFCYKSDERIHIISMKKDEARGTLLRAILRHLLAQPRIAFHLLKISKKIDIVILFLGTRTYLLPLLTAKLLGKKTVLAVQGSEAKGAKRYSNRLFGLGRAYSTTVMILERINFRLADQITVESEGTIDFQGLNKFREKTAINGAMYIDTECFSVKSEVKDRDSLVAYIGRLSREKGIMNLIKAVPLILKGCEGVEFLVGGDGSLFDEIKNELEDNSLGDKVKITGWLPHDELPGYLGEIKLLVLPSESEGLPGIVQEAMACGTPVLATPVGAVPDLIKDGETGFIMENNSPECIATNVVRALKYPRLNEIVLNARRLIEQEYTYGAMVEKCRAWLNNLMGSK